MVYTPRDNIILAPGAICRLTTGDSSLLERQINVQSRIIIDNGRKEAVEFFTENLGHVLVSLPKGSCVKRFL